MAFVFPIFNNAVITQYPYGEDKSRYVVTQSYVPSGFAATSVWNPSQPLARFAVQFEVMTPSERRILEAFWALVGGPVGSFSLTDDAGVTHTDCHFEADSLQLQYLSAAHCAVQFTIVALN